MNDIKFIRDEVQEKKIKQLQEILDILSTKPKDLDVEAAKRFFLSMLKAAQRLSEIKEEEAEKERKIKEIEKKKPPKPKLVPSNMHKILKEIEQPPPMPIPTPLPETLEIPTELPKPEEFKKPEEPPKIENRCSRK